MLAISVSQKHVLCIKLAGAMNYSWVDALVYNYHGAILLSFRQQVVEMGYIRTKTLDNRATLHTGNLYI